MEQVETEERIRALNASLEAQAQAEERTAALKATSQEMETFYSRCPVPD